MNFDYQRQTNDNYNQIHYGENDNEYFIDIEAKANELQLTWDNPKQFKHIMKNLEREVMGGYISDEENPDIPKPDSNYIKGINGNIIEKPRPINTIGTVTDPLRQGSIRTNIGNVPDYTYSTNPYNTNLNVIQQQPYSLKPIYHNINSANIYQTSSLNERSHSPGTLRNKKLNKKYTDVHANSKYYYPSEMNASYDDLTIEQSQWNDRSNRNALYTTNANTYQTTQYSDGRIRTPNRANRSFYEDDYFLRDNSNPRNYLNNNKYL
jgi:hypothetical protein